MLTQTQPVIPYLMRDRPKDSRGFVTPWIVDRDDGSEIDFRVLTPSRIRRALNDRLCAMCGQRMGRYVYFIGGPMSYQNKVFNDPAMHESCARYALVACPHLSRPGASYSQRPAEEGAVKDQTVLQTKPAQLGLMKARDQKVDVHRVGAERVPHISPDRWISVIWFDTSKPMTGQVSQMPTARE